MALGIEAAGFDQSVLSFRNQIGFDHAALDLVENGGERTGVREGFSYYSGFPAETIPVRVPTGERRRFVILDAQPGESQYEILYISADYSSNQAGAVRSIIDSVELSSGGEPTEVVLATQVSPPGAATINGGGVYSPAEEVVLSFVANPGYRFVEWQGGVSDSTALETSITPSADVTVTAVFVRQWELVVEAEVGGAATGGGFYDPGSMVSITALAEEGYRFDGWTGTGIADPMSSDTTVTVNEAHTVGATFVKVWNVSVSAPGDGGSVSGSGTFDDGTVATIQASVEEGYRFAGWNGEGIADVQALETTVTVTADATPMASFVKVWHVSVGGAGDGGSVSGSGTFDDGAVATIQASVEEGYRFAGWNGEGIADVQALETTVTVTADATPMASFVKVWTLMIDGTDGGTVAGAGIVDAGDPVTVTATPMEGYRFDQWEGEGIVDRAAPETTITLSADTRVTANFVKVWTLDVGSTVGGSAVGGGTFDAGMLAPLTATVDEGYRFGSWEGEGIADATALETTIVVDAARMARATFIKVWTLELAASEGGQVSGGGTFDEGTFAEINAVAEEGHEFVRWEGSDAIADPNMAQTSILIAQAHTLSSVFRMLDPEPMPDLDSDGDGIPDLWEAANGLDAADPTDAAEDIDNDAYTNIEEYMARTDPQDPQSRLWILSVATQSDRLTLQWSSVPGVTYQIEATDDLAARWQDVTAITAEEAVSSVPDIDPEVGPYYRVRVKPDPED